MRIAIVGLIRIVIFCFFFGCTTHQLLNEDSKKISNFLIKKSVKQNNTDIFMGSLLDESEDKIIFRSRSNQTIKIFTSQFSERKLAIQHMLGRRVALSAMYIDQVEPYYGLVEKRKCVDLSQPSSNFTDQDKSTYFSMIFPADRGLNLFDCDKGEPPMHVQYTLVLCSQSLRVFEIRVYQENENDFPLVPIISCN